MSAKVCLLKCPSTKVEKLGLKNILRNQYLGSLCLFLISNLARHKKKFKRKDPGTFENRPHMKKVCHSSSLSKIISELCDPSSVFTDDIYTTLRNLHITVIFHYFHPLLLCSTLMPMICWTTLCYDLKRQSVFRRLKFAAIMWGHIDFFFLSYLRLLTSGEENKVMRLKSFPP